MSLFQCQQCGAESRDKPSRPRVFCSIACKAKSMQHVKPRPCKSCGKSFKPHADKGIYCSPSCVWRDTKGSEYNASIARKSAEARGDKQRGSGDGKTYRKRDGRHEHRVIAERMLGRPLNRGEIVHHIDGNYLNNTPENLQVMTRREHMLTHGIGIPGVVPKGKPWEVRWGKK